MAVVPDNLLNDVKVTALSPSAFRLWVFARVLCSANGTDGLVPASALTFPLAARKRDVDELVAAGLWDKLQSGSVVDNTYLEHNPAAADAEAEREAIAEERAMAAARMRRKRQRDRERNASRDASQEPSRYAERYAEHSPSQGQAPLPPHTPPSPAFAYSENSSGSPEVIPPYQPPDQTDPVARACEAKAPKTLETERQVREVFAFWQESTGRTKTKLDRKRAARIRARLAEKFTVEDLRKAIANRVHDDWLMGRDPKSPRVFDGLETLLRDAAQVERLRDMGPGKSNGDGVVLPTWGGRYG